MTKRLSARALFYAILVSILVALMTSAMLLGSYQQHQLMGRYASEERLIDNCQSGMALMMSTGVEVVAPQWLELFGNGRDSVWVQQAPWGLLDVLAVKSWRHGGGYADSVVQTALVGKAPPKYALQLAESTKPLQLYGKTRLVGDAYLPRAGVERGYANIGQGTPYEGDQLVYGERRPVQPQSLSALQTRFATLDSLLQAPATVLLESDSLIQPFHQPTAVLQADWFQTEGLVLKGHVLVIASERIEVQAASILEDVVLMAPYIRIESGFRGTVQAFAWDSLVVEPQVELAFPSVLSLLPRVPEGLQGPHLTIGPESQITGSIVVPRFQYTPQASRVILPPNAQVIGQVWVTGIFDHQGTVWGSVACQEFLLKTPKGLYPNCLLDAIIDRSKLPEVYLGPSVLSEATSKQVLKYL